MIYSDSDFTKYHDDFYVGGKSGDAKAAALDSLDRLRAFARFKAHLFIKNCVLLKIPQ